MDAIVDESVIRPVMERRGSGVLWRSCCVVMDSVLLPTGYFAGRHSILRTTDIATLDDSEWAKMTATFIRGCLRQGPTSRTGNSRIFSCDQKYASGICASKDVNSVMVVCYYCYWPATSTSSGLFSA